MQSKLAPKKVIQNSSSRNPQIARGWNSTSRSRERHPTNPKSIHELEAGNSKSLSKERRLIKPKCEPQIGGDENVGAYKWVRARVEAPEESSVWGMEAIAVTKTLLYTFLGDDSNDSFLLFTVRISSCCQISSPSICGCQLDVCVLGISFRLSGMEIQVEGAESPHSWTLGVLSPRIPYIEFGRQQPRQWERNLQLQSSL